MKLSRSKPKGQMDFALFIAILLLCTFGVVMVFSASYYWAQSRQGDGLHYVKSQLGYLVLGVIAMYVISRVDYHKWDKLKVWGLGLTIVLMIAVVLVGKELNGAKRWLAIGNLVSFQPSEFAKFALVLYMASFMSARPARMTSFKLGVFPLLLITGVICACLLLQKNMSMMVIVLLTSIMMLFLGGAQIRHLLLICIAAVPLLFLFAKIEPYRWARLVIFTDPWKDAKKSGYQLIQSLYAFGSGGIFGQGLNFSKQKLLFLTYGESDFIFSIIGEELGFAGAVSVMLAYIFVVYRGMRTAMRSSDMFGALMAAGITGILGMQAAVNIGVATSSVPPTGQTLPFISAGGTSLFIFLCAMGIVLSISRSAKE